MKFLINTHLHLAIDSLRQNRGRTFLSALGIAIGVASIVLILSLTGGINRLISTKSNKDSANLVLVRPSKGKDAADSIIEELTNANQYSKSNLTVSPLPPPSPSAIPPSLSATKPILLQTSSQPMLTYATFSAYSSRVVNS